MIKGVGTDIIEIERIEKAILKEGFKNRVYTERELENIARKGNRSESFAGVFAAKEAISKALGTGIGKLALKDIEIFNDEKGKPFAKITDFSLKIEISISHSKEFATAIAIIWEK